MFSAVYPLSVVRSYTAHFNSYNLVNLLTPDLLMLIASIIALLVGPWLLCRFQNNHHILMLLDGFSFMVIGGLVCLHIIPESLGESFVAGVIFLLLGFTGPAVIERWVRTAARQAHFAALSLAVLGLFIHSLIDGTAMSEAVAAESQGALPLAVLLHRLPVGMMIWALLRPVLGFAGTVSMLVFMGLCTIVGFFLGEQFEALWQTQATIWFQALVAGSLLHVLIHRPHWAASGMDNTDAPGLSHRFEGIGNILGIGLLVWLALEPVMAHHDANDAPEKIYNILLAMSYETAPALLLAYALGGLLMSFSPQTPVRWLQRGNALIQANKGMLVGLPLPICSCGVTPIYHALVRKGVPASAAMAFLIATPELGIDALMISLPLLGTEMAVLRLIAAAIMAVLVGWLVGRFVLSQQPTDGVDESLPEAGRFSEKVRQGLKHGFGELVDNTAPWILFGLVLGAALQPALELGWVSQLPAGVDVFLFAGLGMPLYVCASGATPLVAVFLLNGVSPGAALVFLLTGPATNATTFGVLQNLHGRKVAIMFALAIMSSAIVLGLLANRWLLGHDWVPVTDWVEQQPSWIEQISLLALAALFLVSLLKRGGRAFVQEIFPATVGCQDHEHNHHKHHHDEDQNCCDS